MWPFAAWIPAQRASRHRDAGTLKLKSIPANKETHKQMLLIDDLPSIEVTWLSWDGKNVVLQHDNARHIDQCSMLTLRKLRLQTAGPPLGSSNFQSSDLNVLNLGLFFSRSRACSSRTT